ncbi:D-alanyl-D-alanine carboxypeptidase/D-alanyl-D-alanine endopeptidase [Shewanella litorisediminis]|uniref:D-alanyl-D-alanine carboxypeptidase/D-alanyl-D-alanine-endopeptidase n=1 Tax=Shewanella litorisediminis TaxID=1173586 RepID=A0ABX7G854_9GAMM|nr:D-alanyl-D-alanine carboxypeptidase/D-alanyl-D-alanine-endopeptidase [Shewanella litorisediminis]MCL2919193.1 D-alanyl-D-alanine carboxypeptidase/D-alanyl-D-alanine-endopeptidase [Shewanella litorisediminis]QRH03436.1 D-alanyl-D-alanine carboxypeptidase/D-alanyl-D-alanine-endopeptidase [Shewanella litorisediminis]
MKARLFGAKHMKVAVQSLLAISVSVIIGAISPAGAREMESTVTASPSVGSKPPEQGPEQAYPLVDATGTQASSEPTASPVLPTSVLSPVKDITPDWYLAIKPKLTNVAVLAVDLKTHQVVISDNSERAMLPASVQKLLLALAARHTLGPDFRFHTQLFVQGMKPPVLDRLYIGFSGDPLLSSSELSTLFASLKQQGIRTINKVYLVSAVDKSDKAPGWVWDDLGVCYASPVAEFSLDKNCVKASLRPTDKGDATYVWLAKDAAITVDNQLSYRPGASFKECSPHLAVVGPNRYLLHGCYSGKQALPLSIAVTHTDVWLQDKVAGLLKKAGLTAPKPERLHRLPGGAHLVADHQSAPMDSLLSEMLKESDNLIADAFLKQLSKTQGQDESDFYQGSKEMAANLERLGVDLSSAKLVDGSGLSRYNLLNARQLMQTLLLIHHTEDYAPLKYGLPVSGKDGTLLYKRGFSSGSLKERVLAKTGSMQGVSNLAGFLRTDDREYAFVVLENGLVEPENPSGKRSQGFAATLLKSLLQQEQQQMAAQK